MQITAEMLDAGETAEIVSQDTGRGIVQLLKSGGDTLESPFVVAYEYTTGGNFFAWGCKDFSNARLVFGLISAHRESVGNLSEQFGGFTEIIPTAIAVNGIKHTAAYLKLVLDEDRTRRTRPIVAQMLDVSDQTVSNYWNDIRWDGCISCASEDVATRFLTIDGDQVAIVDCLSCGEYFVEPEDKQLMTHTEHTSEEHQPACVDSLESVIGENGGNEYQILRCPACGYHTSSEQ